MAPVLGGTSETCLAIASGSFAARLARLQVTDDEQVVALNGPGGMLVVDSPYWTAKRLDEKLLALFHSGCAVSPGFLPIVRRGSRTDSGTRLSFTIPNVDAGSYSYCAVNRVELAAYSGGPPNFETCASGTLAPGSSLNLTLLP